jgi:hypothetical protein
MHIDHNSSTILTLLFRLPNSKSAPPRQSNMRDPTASRVHLASCLHVRHAPLHTISNAHRAPAHCGPCAPHSPASSPPPPLTRGRESDRKPPRELSFLRHHDAVVNDDDMHAANPPTQLPLGCAKQCARRLCGIRRRSQDKYTHFEIAVGHHSSLSHLALELQLVFHSDRATQH